MSFIEKFSKVDQKFSWSFLGFIIGIIGIGFTIYTIFFFDKAPVIKYEIISNTNVLDIKENVSRLDILFDSVSVKKSGQNLRVITLKISNEGNENFNADFFDSKSPLGFQIEGAKIVQKPELIGFSNEYIKETIELTEVQFNKIFFSNIIIDQGEYFTIKTLTLSDEGIIPTIKPLGYISGSGVPKLVVINNETEATPKSFFKKLFYGNFGYHILRFFIYLIIIGLFIILIAMPISKIQDRKDEKKKKQNVLKFKKHTKIAKELLSEKVFEFYKESGESYLFRIKRLISMPDKLLEYKDFLDLSAKFEDFEYGRYRMHIEPNREELNPEIRFDESQIYKDDRRLTLFDELLKEKIIQIAEGTVVIDKAFEKTLDEFIYFIKIQ